jgi:hypothetical protein
VVMPYIHPCTLTSVHSFFFPLSLGGVGRAANLLSQPTNQTYQQPQLLFCFCFKENPPRNLEFSSSSAFFCLSCTSCVHT